MPEPIHTENNLWYFWDETWADRHGPFRTEDEARTHLELYTACELGYERDSELTAKVLLRMKDVSDRTLLRLMQADRKRGHAWRDIGLIGLFLEIRTMYLRLRHQVWDEQSTTKSLPDYKPIIKDILTDLRTYSILAELALEDNNWKGLRDDSSLKHMKEAVCGNCGHRHLFDRRSLKQLRGKGDIKCQSCGNVMRRPN